jgi:cytochrome P450
MYRLTLAAIAKSLYSASFTESQITAFSKAISFLLDDISTVQSGMTGNDATFSPQRNRQLDEANGTIDAFVYDMISARRSDSSPPDDLLTRLLSSRNERNQPMSDVELRDEVVTLLLAGHETTAMSLTWAWYLLSQHPEAERRLHAELDAKLKGHASTVDDLPHLPWTRQVIQETLRLYPPIWVMVRHATESGLVGDIEIDEDDCLVVCTFAAQRHPNYWEEPAAFHPERFASKLSRRQQDAYFPFGEGGHMCIGMHVATLEQAMVVSTLAQRFRVRPLPDREVKPIGGATLRIRNGMQATIEFRV